MSLAEVIDEITRMSPADRAEVERRLRLLRWKNDPDMPARIDAAMARMDAGQKVSADEIERRLNEKFSSGAA
ncbi:MAG: hypothetical protein ABII82_05010 [Verrucomicrobiota bacterium]